jgi:hypothetical protein
VTCGGILHLDFRRNRFGREAPRFSCMTTEQQTKLFEEFTQGDASTASRAKALDGNRLELI